MIELKTATLNDLDNIFNIETNNFFSEKYSIGALKDFITNNSKLDIIRVLLKDDKLIAYIIYRLNNDESELFKICVDDFYRHKGYGTILMDDFLNYARQNNIKKIFLEVRAKNDIAIKFYKQYGFYELSYRKNYYNDPVDDAVNMQLDL